MNRLKVAAIFTFCILTILLANGYNTCVFADDNNVGVYIDGTAVVFPDVKPYISNSRTFVPVRFISEQLGASVNWNSETGMIVITKDNDSIKLVVGSTEVTKNGVSSSMDVAPMITDGRTMVPLRFVSEQFNAVVDWDASSNSVLIVTAKPETAVYTVKTGDTLWRISSTYGISMDELLKVNPGLSPDKLTIGQQLNLPSASAVKEPDPSSATKGSGSPLESTEAETPVVSRGEGRAISLSCTSDEFVEYAKEFLGTPYAYGGTTPGGFDCSGFTHYVAANFGGYLPHSSSEQFNYGVSVEKEDLQPGDLVFFEASDGSKKIGHVGIYIGDGKFIHAPQAGGVVQISNMSNVYFNQYYYGAVRILQ